MKPLHVKAHMKISKPPHEVFEGIVDPVQLSRYFTSSSTGRLDEGRTVTWRWADFGDAKADVTPLKVITDKFISFRWGGPGDETTVEISLESVAPAVTRVEIIEDGWEKDDHGIARLADNTFGWADFLCCLKGYLEHGINLRHAAF
ncbi:Activator of Hsp90 ATPase 1 family protein [Candidatus Zixiibacteriota bacterium]|nr:Activator of Hsp90 ATPase 1 family protein [candidate division Zixibacteria bacterium]